MIPQASITAWAQHAPWPTEEQVEQDLLLSRVIIEVANHPILGRELVFRGGTCFHKLTLERPWRYSEDLDYVRASSGPVGPVLDALREIGDALGMRVRTDVGAHPKVYLLGEYESGQGTMKIKVEMNTYERSPSRPHASVLHGISTDWWSGSGEVLTFADPELVATKIRALRERRKGRDLFDVWLALEVAKIDPAEIVECFEPYRPVGFTPALARETLAGHLAQEDFRRDLDSLIVGPPEEYDVDQAAALYDERVLALIR